MVDKFLTKLSENLLEILNDEEYCDIIIEVGNDPYVKVFRAHMVILNYRSFYLRRILSTLIHPIINFINENNFLSIFKPAQFPLC